MMADYLNNNIILTWPHVAELNNIQTDQSVIRGESKKGTK